MEQEAGAGGAIFPPERRRPQGIMAWCLVCFSTEDALQFFWCRAFCSLRWPWLGCWLEFVLCYWERLICDAGMLAAAVLSFSVFPSDVLNAVLVYCVISLRK